MELMLIVLASMVVATRADCEACIDGWCHFRNMLIQGYEAGDKMAIDRLNNILYVHITSTEDSLFLEDDMKIQEIRTNNLTAMAVDQDKQVLYITDTAKKLYKYVDGSVTNESNFYQEVKKMQYLNGYLYYLTELWNDNVMLYARIPMWYHKEDYPIRDFVVDKDENIYFVANDTVYMMNQFNIGRPKGVMWGIKSFELSTDKFGDVYIGDSTLSVIYKISNGSIILYAAYKTGTMNEFVFDDNNNIVFHDLGDGTVNIWNSELSKCYIEKVHAAHEIREESSNLASSIFNDTLLSPA